MCNHVFNYPQDTKKNYNIDGETLTGVCRYCGLKQQSYGMRWSIPLEDRFLHQDPGNDPFNYIDTTRKMY